MSDIKEVEDDKIVWYGCKEWPDVISDSNRGCSIDVLIHDPKTDEHTVGWFNFGTFKWLFLRNENVNRRFKWRYFVDKYDRYKKPKNQPSQNE